MIWKIPLAISLHKFRYRSDNYGFVIHDIASGETACIDAGSRRGLAEREALRTAGWSLTQLWITHHHPDHVEGLVDLKQATDCHVFGPGHSASPINGIDTPLVGGETFLFAGLTVKVIDTPGHTLDMLNYYLPTENMVFTGDTLFAMGCGRLFEGTAAQMHASLEKLKLLPPQTQVYCSHEYTKTNAEFALSVDSQNQALVERCAHVSALEAKGKATVPTNIAVELATNPFFRCGDPSIRAHLGMEQASDADVFAELRRRKDNF